MRLWPEERMGRAAEKLRRIKRRDVRSERVVLVLKRSPSGIDDKSAEAEENKRGRKPPGIAARGLAEPAIFPDYVGS